MMFFMTSLLGKKYKVYINPSSQDCTGRQILELIKPQLPASYHTDNLNIICEGKNLLSFDSFENGVCSYFSTLAGIFVVGGNPRDECVNN
jgi:hypothetical protein